ncbi:MAG: DUF4386 domain-containing protein [Gemmatimonadaceae bacterium]
MSAIATAVVHDFPRRDVAAPAQRSSEMSPRTMARVSAVLLLATIIGGIYAQGFLSDRLIVAGDAAATARNIIANPSIVRTAFAIFMIEMACQIGTTAAMYQLLKPVDRSLSAAAAVFGYVGCGIKILARLFFYAPLFVLGGSSYLSAFNHGQLEAISSLLIRINDLGAGTACIFLGINTLLVGYLMLRATFLPRVLGVLGVIGGAGWLSYLYPPLASMVFMPVALFALVGCAVTIGWLLVRGVDEGKWHEMATASTTSIWR